MPGRAAGDARTPEVVDAFFAEVARARGANARLDRWLDALRRDLADHDEAEYRARDLVDRMALALQAALLLQHAPHGVGDAYCASRLGDGGQRHYGTLPRGVDCTAIIERATPRA